MKNSEAVIRSILGAADVDIRPLAYAVDAAVELMFRQGIPEDDIAVIKELYAKAPAEREEGETQCQDGNQTDSAGGEYVLGYFGPGRDGGAPPRPAAQNHPCAQRDDFLSGLPGLLGNTVFPGDGGRENSAFFSSGEPKTSQFQKKKEGLREEKILPIPITKGQGNL